MTGHCPPGTAAIRLRKKGTTMKLSEMKKLGEVIETSAATRSSGRSGTGSSSHGRSPSSSSATASTMA